MSLSTVTDVMLKFNTKEWYQVPSAELKFADVKQVGSYQRDGDSMSSPGSPPTYVTPKIGIRLEKEMGPKRPPEGLEEYKAYIDKRHTLVESASTAGASLDKDVVIERESLMLLLEYLSEDLNKKFKVQGQYQQEGVDLMKISKASGSKSLVFEKIYQRTDLFAERRNYMGQWKRSEVSHHGTYCHAWNRLATGDTSKISYVCTGLKQIAGKRAGKLPLNFRFVEYSLGGLSFLTRTLTQATRDGKSVELKTRNFYHQDEYTMLQAYYEMLLGGVDMTALAIHRSGKITDVIDVPFDSLLEKLPELKDAAEKRLGRLVAVIKKVKEAIEGSSDEGPWVLQWQRGNVVLGKYQDPVDEEGEDVEADALEIQLEEA